MRAARQLGVIVAALTLLGVVYPAAAQTPPFFGLGVEGQIETGVRFLPNEPSKSRSAKFEEYRDITEGLFLPSLQLRFFTPTESYSTEISGSKWGQDDQEFGLRTGRLGLWQFDFEWDQIPHTFSTNSRTLFQETSPGVFKLPTPRPNLFNWNTAPSIDEIGVRWDTARISLGLTPTPDLDLRAQYTRIRKAGDMPLSLAFSSPGGDFAEFAAPIDQTVHDFRIGGTYAREQWQIKFDYTFSMFDNGLKAYVVDNPCLGLSAALVAGGCAGQATGAEPTGLLSAAPDNMAHTFTLAGGVNLPFRTRINAAASYSFRLQNESFLAHNVNPAISSPSLALPQKSLDGYVGTTLFNVQATSRPISPLTLTAKYRLYDFHDTTDELEFAGHVVNDRTLVVEERLAGRFGYTKHNADLDARWRFGAPLAVTLGGAWEKWDRVSHREVQDSDEYFAKLAVDVTPFDWMNARLTYKPSFRRVGDYKTFAHLQHTVIEDITPSEFAQGQSVLLRKFDEADRNRQRVDLLLQFFPLEDLTTGLAFGWKDDDYYNTTLGLQRAKNYSIGIDLGWSPHERLSFYAGYVHEWIDQRQRQRSRPVTGSTTFDFPDYDWISESTDTTDNVYAGARVWLIPRVLQWNVSGSYQFALGRINNSNPVTPTSGTAAQILTATAKPMSSLEDELLRIDTTLRYSFWKNWFATVGYAFESFRKNDFRTDQLTPVLPGVTSSIWLGNDARNYAAHILTATLGYRFP